MAELETDGETKVLLGSLNRQREHVLGIVDGLSEEDLRRPVLPSGWTCLGMVQHLALSVERFWFRGVAAGEPVDFSESDAEHWRVPVDVTAQDVLAAYRREAGLANAIIEATPLGIAPARWPEEWSTWRYSDLREIMLHVITETACHAGHLDAVRELIDGRTWVVL